MIPFDITFVRAATADEAVTAWRQESSDGRPAYYYGGGTEIVTSARDRRCRSDVFIDYKRVPEAGVFGVEADRFTVGAAVRLNTIVDTPGAGPFARCAAGVADRTVRNSITAGGNICGMLPYRELVLPFLALDGEVTIARPAEAGATIETRPLTEAFDKRLRMPAGGLALSFAVPSELVEGLGLLGARAQTEATDRTGASRESTRRYGAVTAGGEGARGGWFYRRNTRDAQLDYPLATTLLCLIDGSFRMAVAGAWGYPVRAGHIERELNALGPAEIARLKPAEIDELAHRVIDMPEVSFRRDMRGSAEYRRELAVQTVMDGLAELTKGEL